MRCELEGETIRAMRTGAWSPELLRHTEDCSGCREALRVAEALLEDASRLQAHAAPPLAAHVWARAQREQRKAALERTAIFLRILKFSGWAYAVAFIAWGLHSLHGLGGDPMLLDLNGKALNATFGGAIFAVLCVGSGVWYALRRDERQMS